MVWGEYKLGDIVAIKHGFAFKGEFFSEEPTGNILLTPGNFKIGGGYKGSKLKYYNGEIPQSYVLSTGDIVVTMTDLSKMADTLGYSAKIPSGNSKVFLHNQRIGLVKQLDDNFDPDFLYWLMRTEHYQKFVAGSATGVTVKHTSPSKIYAFKFKAPTKKQAQQKIARILSAYDDLIENNLKRIKLLEEMAQITYEQWFVRMKFPGHETTPINAETGLPEGWKNSRLGDVLVLNYGKALKADNRKVGTVPVYGSAGVVGSHDESLVDGPGVIVGRKGNVGSVFWSNIRFFPIDTVFYVMSELPLLFVFFLLKYIEFINNDAAVPGLNRNAAYMVKIKIPPLALIRKFSEYVDHNFQGIEMLSQQNQLLKEARDILLPRLMTGMIDVDEIELPYISV